MHLPYCSTRGKYRIMICFATTESDGMFVWLVVNHYVDKRGHSLALLWSFHTWKRLYYFNCWLPPYKVCYPICASNACLDKHWKNVNKTERQTSTNPLSLWFVSYVKQPSTTAYLWLIIWSNGEAQASASNATNMCMSFSTDNSSRARSHDKTSMRRPNGGS